MYLSMLELQQLQLLVQTIRHIFVLRGSFSLEVTRAKNVLLASTSNYARILPCNPSSTFLQEGFTSTLHCKSSHQYLCWQTPFTCSSSVTWIHIICYYGISGIIQAISDMLQSGIGLEKQSTMEG